MADITELQGKLDSALGALKELQSAPGLYELACKTKIGISKLWAGAGGSALFHRVWLPPWALGDNCSLYELTWRLAHELTHVKQGILFFGSLDTEREAYIVQCRVQAELLKRQRPVPRQELARVEAGLRALQGGSASAKFWILRQGPYYANFPDTQPRLWQVNKWWPQVAYAVRAARGHRPATKPGPNSKRKA